MKNRKLKIKNGQSPKVAIIHDWLYGGGAELVVEELHKMYPDAPIYTSYCTDEWRRRLDNKVITGYLQHWPFSKLRKFLPVLRQHWFKNLDLSQFDLVISSSGNGEAKFVLPRKDTRIPQANEKLKIENRKSNVKPVHICYCHSPTHFYWRKYDEYLENPGFKPKWLARLGLKLLVKPLRKRDYQAAQRVDYFIANSSHIQSDIKKYYGRDSVVIHPPVNTGKWKMENGKLLKPRSGFIMWGRHVPYKRFDLAIKACNKLRLPLTIIGEGPETENLKNLAGPTITFTGRLDSVEEIAKLARQAEAFIFPGEEDFGIAPVEALAAGLPIIAYKSGGALDYVIEGKTGIFFTKQTQTSLAEAVVLFKSEPLDHNVLIKTAEQFSAEQFKSGLRKLIDSGASSVEQEAK